MKGGKWNISINFISKKYIYVIIGTIYRFNHPISLRDTMSNRKGINKDNSSIPLFGIHKSNEKKQIQVTN